MRIAIGSQTYDPRINGQGVFTIHLAEGLARAGHAVLLLMPSERRRGYRAERGGVQIRAISALSLAPLYRDVYVTLRPAREVRASLDEFQPEIVHIQDHYPLCRAVLRAARERDLPVIGSNHFLPENMAPEVPLSRFCGRFVERMLWQTVLPVLNRTLLVTTPTPTAAAILREQQLRVPVEPISCGVDLAAFAPDASVDRDEMRRRYGLGAPSTVFFYLGRLDREKRVDLLIDAFARLRRDDLQLAIAGRGREEPALRAQVERLALGRRVVFTGFVPAEDLPALLNSVDLFAIPSEAELQSIATLEAMATGLPVLAADARALPELVRHGVNGCLFHAGDVEDACRWISYLADERARWEAMGQASREIAGGHNLAATIQQYAALYARITQGSPWVKHFRYGSAPG